MNWFKHDTDSHESEKMLRIIANEGLEWYARWFIILELIAKKMDKTDRCHVELPLSDWAKILRVKPQKLLRFCEHYGNVLGMFSELNGEILRIKVPNLLKKKDEYSKKSRHLSGQCTSQEIRDKREEYLVVTNVTTCEPDEAEKAERVDWNEILTEWNDLTKRFPRIPAIREIHDTRKNAIRSRMNSPDFDIKVLFSKIESSDFLNGSASDWCVHFDWIFKKANFTKIMEGNYENNRRSNPNSSKPKQRAGHLTPSGADF